MEILKIIQSMQSYCEDVVTYKLDSNFAHAVTEAASLLVSQGERITELEEVLEQRPTVDAVEVAHGEWATIEDDYLGLTALQCSECNQQYWFEEEPPMKIYNYCPNCGAKMDGEVTIDGK